jgi:hypothetical protein
MAVRRADSCVSQALKDADKINYLSSGQNKAIWNVVRVSLQ